MKGKDGMKAKLCFHVIRSCFHSKGEKNIWEMKFDEEASSKSDFVNYSVINSPPICLIFSVICKFSFDHSLAYFSILVKSDDTKCIFYHISTEINKVFDKL